MRPVHTRALVLRRTDWSETSQIVTVDTRDHGIVDLLAKGSRRMARPSSSFAEPLDLAGWYDVVYRPRRGELHLAVEARLIEGFSHLRTDLAAWTEACFALDLVRTAFTAGDPHPEMLRSTLSLLKLLGVGRGRLALRTRFVIELLHRSGVWSGWERCAGCSETLVAGEVFWHPPGALLCPRCRDRGDSPFAEPLRKTFSELSRSPWGNLPGKSFSAGLLAASWERARAALLDHLEQTPRSLRYLRSDEEGASAPALAPE